MNKPIIALIAVVIAVGVAAFYFGYKDGGTAANPAAGGTVQEGSTRYMDINAYVQNNISTLSPVKEQVGGTFYVTKIATADGSGVVEYEDGHNAYTADFSYVIEEDGKPTVSSFVVRE